jgi:hypothetical protein
MCCFQKRARPTELHLEMAAPQVSAEVHAQTQKPAMLSGDLLKQQ